jgi:hypothetical protein
MNLLAMYIPHLERAFESALVQFAIIAVLASALYAYGRSRCGQRTILNALIIGELVSLLPLLIEVLVGQGDYGNTCRGFGENYPDWVLAAASYFELFTFAISSFICLIVATGIAVCAPKSTCGPS